MDRINPDVYALRGIDSLETPSLVYYEDYIIENTRRAIKLAGGASRLWPHVKSHKMQDMVKLQMQMGITRFKCATIAEAQMTAQCGAEHILLSYPLVGPNIGRFIRLQARYGDSHFYAVGDDRAQIELLSEASERDGRATRFLLDVDMGMGRTGTPLERVEAMYEACAALPGLQMSGLHCYDGHIHAPALQTRKEEAHDATSCILEIAASLRGKGLPCAGLVLGGTPTFPVHAALQDVYLSPGTVFLGDAMCLEGVREQAIQPAAGVWTRVISHPGGQRFTLDLGVKAISTDQPGSRGIIVGLQQAKPLFQSEEHWVLEMPQGEELPAIGQAFFVIPTHICPTTALYPFAHVARNGEVVGQWDVTARNRNLGI